MHWIVDAVDRLRNECSNALQNVEIFVCLFVSQLILFLSFLYKKLIFRPVSIFSFYPFYLSKQNFYVRLFFCLFVSLSLQNVDFSVCLYICLFVCLSVYFSVSLFPFLLPFSAKRWLFCPSLYDSVCLSLCSPFSYLSLQNVDFSVLDVDLISEFAEFVGQPVLVLGGGQRCLGLLLNHLFFSSSLQRSSST